ncbi:MAG: GTPase Era [Proteobacteria bacterium]|nr:GTPase Era [Pseudomonadota bacterium]
MTSTRPGGEPARRRAGFVAVIGAPNAGKSTLLNRLIGAKIAIVTPKVQTTRARAIGILIHGPAQLVFVDTPGIFEPSRRLERAMVSAAWRGAETADIVLLLVDAARPADADTARIMEGLRNARHEAVLALNKIDLVKRPELLPLADRLRKEGIFSRVFMISGATGDGVSELVDYLAERIPEGPWLYPEDQLSDVSERLLAAEVTREQLFLQLQQELPYALTVETESWKELEDGSVRIDQIIYVLRESQKPILLGKGGRRIRSVGSAARKELERMLERRVHLFLFVKVRPDWIDRVAHYRAMGLEYKA